MIQQKVEDVKDVALKLDKIRTFSPDDYFYLKGWIHCLTRKENGMSNHSSKPPIETS